MLETIADMQAKHKLDIDREARRFEEQRKHYEVEQINIKAALL